MLVEYSNIEIVPSSSEELLLSTSSCLTLSTRSALLQQSNTRHSLLYVASAPCFCFHFLSIAIFRACTECVDSRIAISSASVSPRKGETARQSAMMSEITQRWFSEQGWFQPTGCCSHVMAAQESRVSLVSMTVVFSINCK